MKVLVVPDIHLKPEMFNKAAALFDNTEAQAIVVLGDIVDDFGKQYDVGLYEQTLDCAAAFAKKYTPFWCYGNHDVSYLWEYRESGYSPMMAPIVRAGIGRIERELGDRMAFIHRIDNVIFSHAGISKGFAKCQKGVRGENIDADIVAINQAHKDNLWIEGSPLWWRPQLKTWRDGLIPLWEADYLQVVGHTPMRYPQQDFQLLSCDTFSTYTDGTPYGSQEFVVVDTISKEWYPLR